MIIDYRVLLQPFSVFLICLIISASSITYFYYDKSIAIEKLQSTQTNLNRIRAVYAKDLELKSIYLSHEHQFTALQSSGFYSEEQRLNWIDVIEKTSQRIKLPYLSYTIDSKAIVSDQKFNRDYPGLDLFTSSMTLDLQLLHEGDIYNLFNLLKNNANGIFNIEMCAITRNSLQNETLDYHENGKSFSALCNINWYTVLKATPKKPSLSRRR